MQTYEISPYLRNIHLRSKDNWEQARLNAYVTALVNSSKKLRITDIMEFPWEEKKSITSSDIERLKNKANQYLKNGKI